MLQMKTDGHKNHFADNNNKLDLVNFLGFIFYFMMRTTYSGPEGSNVIIASVSQTQIGDEK